MCKRWYYFSGRDRRTTETHAGQIAHGTAGSEGTPCGGVQDIPVDTRIISATNQNIEEALSEGRFRRDLYFRLNTVILNILPLQDRKEDVARLLIVFLDKFNKKYKVHKAFSSSAFLPSYLGHGQGIYEN